MAVTSPTVHMTDKALLVLQIPRDLSAESKNIIVREQSRP